MKKSQLEVGSLGEAALEIQVRDGEGLDGGGMRVWSDVRTFRESEWHRRKSTV